MVSNAFNSANEIEKKTKYRAALETHVSDHIESEGHTLPQQKQFPTKVPAFLNLGSSGGTQSDGSSI